MTLRFVESYIVAQVMHFSDAPKKVAFEKKVSRRTLLYSSEILEDYRNASYWN